MPDTSDASATRMQHECDTSDTSATQVQHECYTNDTSVTRLKNFDFNNDTGKNIFSQAYVYCMVREKLQEEEKFHTKN